RDRFRDDRRAGHARRAARARGRRPDRPRRRGGGRHGHQRLGQVHAGAGAARAAAAVRRLDSAVRGAARAVPSLVAHRLRAAAPGDRRRGARHRPGGRRLGPGRAQAPAEPLPPGGPGGRDPRPGRGGAVRPGRRLGAGALRGPAAAGAHRPGAGRGARHVRRGRADRGRRRRDPAAARRHARRAGGGRQDHRPGRARARPAGAAHHARRRGPRGPHRPRRAAAAAGGRVRQAGPRARAPARRGHRGPAARVARRAMIDLSLLDKQFFQLALVAALLVGLCAPAVGTFIVQRKLALLGDGIGHVALTGVALGFLTGNAPVLTAVAVAVAGAVAIEVVRARGRTSGDVALALLFYGGIAGGVMLMGIAPGGSNAKLNSYLFGAIASVTTEDISVIGGLAVLVLGVVAV